MALYNIGMRFAIINDFSRMEPVKTEERRSNKKKSSRHFFLIVNLFLFSIRFPFFLKKKLKAHQRSEHQMEYTLESD